MTAPDVGCPANLRDDAVETAYQAPSSLALTSINVAIQFLLELEVPNDWQIARWPRPSRPLRTAATTRPEGARRLTGGQQR
jgi:hypothetical protein